MADISKIRLFTEEYDIKDIELRKELNLLIDAEPEEDIDMEIKEG